MTALLSVSGLCKSFGAIAASDYLELQVAEGEIHAVIGPNGAGKSTLMMELSGELLPDAGRILYDGHDITRMRPQARTRLGIARSYQITSIFPEYDAAGNVALALNAARGGPAGLLKPVRGDVGPGSAARKMLDRVGLGAVADVRASELSHGQQRQLEVAMALALHPRLLLLDEPMAGMGAAETAVLVDLLSRLRGEVTILLVEHDMDVVFALADRISVLVYGRTIASGRPDEIRANPDVRDAYLGTDADA